LPTPGRWSPTWRRWGLPTSTPPHCWRRGGEPPLARKLLDTWEDGRVKLYLTYKALRFRRSRRELFAAGEYLPVEAAGPRAGHVCAFARRRESAWALAAAPRLAARLAMENSGAPLLPPLAFPLGEAAWGETCLLLPAAAPARWRNILTGETVQAAAPSPSPAGGPPRPERQVPALLLAAVFRNFPVALLAPEENSR
jgi:(1->4)-alpha-D-glucan 1-alpha-D-glucosylmutase